MTRWLPSSPRSRVRAPPDDLAYRVASRCGGNPFFVRETARLAFTSTDGWLDLAEPGTITAGVRAVVRRRLDQVSRPCREILALVAVAGDGTDESVVAAASGNEESHEVLDEAEQARIITRENGRLGFVHDLFRQVVLTDQKPARIARSERPGSGGACRRAGPARDEQAGGTRTARGPLRRGWRRLRWGSPSTIGGSSASRVGT